MFSGIHPALDESAKTQCSNQKHNFIANTEAQNILTEVATRADNHLAPPTLDWVYLFIR
jgi:hypothetical protein